MDDKINEWALATSLKLGLSEDWQLKCLESAARNLLAAQREEDAKVCEGIKVHSAGWRDDFRYGVQQCAAAIRGKP